MNSSEELYRVREIWPTGTVIKGDFSILRKLGGGGFGTVYLAQHRFLNTTHVIKRLHEQYASDPEYVRRFVNEARAVRRLRNCPYVVEVEHMTQSEDGHLILVMEHISGGDLARLMDSRQLSVDEVIEYARQIALGLAAAHAAGLVHRDIKPQNVMISHDSNGKPVLKLIDFGIAADHLSHQQTSVMVGGSLGYAAPEQWVKAGKQLDGRTDLYSLGASMYRMLCGRMPYDASDIGDWIEQVKKGPPIAPSRLRGDLPKGLSDLTMELLAVNPESRPANAATVIQRLDTISRDSAKPYPSTRSDAHARTIVEHDVGLASKRQSPDRRPVTRIDPPAFNLGYSRPKLKVWAGGTALFAVALIGAWVAVENKQQSVLPKHDAPPIDGGPSPTIPTREDPPKPKPEKQRREGPRSEPAGKQKQKPAEPIPQEPAPPRPEPAINHSALGDSALNAGDYRAALSHYKLLGDPTRLAKLQRAVESDTEERVNVMLDKGQYAEALRLVEGWWPGDFPNSTRLLSLHTRIVYARDHQ